MKNPENKLWKEDEDLFTSMIGHYVSDKERTFFEKMRYKMEYEIDPSNDLIMFEEDNEDHIYILRCVYEEIIIVHVMTLSEALNANLKELGFLKSDITLLEWLRGRDYEGIRYNHNYAFL